MPCRCVGRSQAGEWRCWQELKERMNNDAMTDNGGTLRAHGIPARGAVVGLGVGSVADGDPAWEWVVW
jgi:hypothetical protein